MKKSVNNKKLILLTLVLLSLIVFTQVLVRAVENTDTVNSETNTAPTSTSSSDQNFFQRWVNANLNGVDSKLLLWLMMFIFIVIIFQAIGGLNVFVSILISIPLSFILIAFVTPPAIIGVFKSYETLPLTLATFLPLGLLFAFTYLAIIKQKTVLITSQWLLWLIYFAFSSLKFVLVVIIYFSDGNGYHFIEYIKKVISTPPNLADPSSFWFWTAMFVTTGIAFFMTFFSGKIVRQAMKQAIELKDAVATAKFQEAQNVLDNLAKMNKDSSK